jgi:hypothetical protein
MSDVLIEPISVLLMLCSLVSFQGLFKQLHRDESEGTTAPLASASLSTPSQRFPQRLSDFQRTQADLPVDFWYAEDN